MRKLRITSMMIVFALMLLISPPFLIFRLVASWKWQNPLPQGNALIGVWGSSGSDVFAVWGSHGGFNGLRAATSPPVL